MDAPVTLNATQVHAVLMTFGAVNWRTEKETNVYLNQSVIRYLVGVYYGPISRRRRSPTQLLTRSLDMPPETLGQHSDMADRLTQLQDAVNSVRIYMYYYYIYIIFYYFLRNVH